VQSAERAAAPWIERFARVGYASKAAVYAIVGVLAAGAAFGRGRVADSDDAFAVIRNLPLGSVLLAIVGLGLIGYAVWQTIAAIQDTDNRGSDAKGIALRISSAFRAFVYAGLGVEAARLAFSLGSRGGKSDATTHWTARVLEMPNGRWLVLAAGVSVVAYGIYQLVRAWKAKLGKRLYIDDLTPSQHHAVVSVSRFGIAARGVVFAIVGVSIARAAQQNSAAEAEGATGALHSLTAFSPWVLAVVALGLVAYAVYELLNARYRVIRAS
jgi:hypothetical protein